MFDKQVWHINKASNFNFNETTTIMDARHFGCVMATLYAQYGTQIIVDFEDCTFTIYDDYVE